MKTFTTKELKEELINCSPAEMLEICLRLAKSKKENKELLTYLLFESSDELSYIKNIKTEIDEQFSLINKSSYYLIKKSTRKILLNIKKYIRFSKNKETEVELLLYFCDKLKHFKPSIHKNTRLVNLYEGQIDLIRKKLTSLHEDLQYDYGVLLDALNKQI
ncbi:MAG: hypothetical protein WCO63_04165 [Bacteroidota bacterium]